MIYCVKLVIIRFLKSWNSGKRHLDDESESPGFHVYLLEPLHTFRRLVSMKMDEAHVKTSDIFHIYYYFAQAHLLKYSV